MDLNLPHLTGVPGDIMLLQDLEHSRMVQINIKLIILKVPHSHTLTIIL